MRFMRNKMQGEWQMYTKTMAIGYQGCFILGIGSEGCSLAFNLLQALSPRGIDKAPHAKPVETLILSSELRWGWDPELVLRTAARSELVVVALDAAKFNPGSEPVKSLLASVKRIGTPMIGVSLGTVGADEDQRAVPTTRYRRRSQGVLASIVTRHGLPWLSPFPNWTVSPDHALVECTQALMQFVDYNQPISFSSQELEEALSSQRCKWLSIGHAIGLDPLAIAVAQAIESLPSEAVLRNAHSVLCGISGGRWLSLYAVNQAINAIRGRACPVTDVLLGVAQYREMEAEAQCTILVSAEGGCKTMTGGHVNAYLAHAYSAPHFADAAEAL
jgi:hypothetical protein